MSGMDLNDDTDEFAPQPVVPTPPPSIPVPPGMEGDDEFSPQILAQACNLKGISPSTIMRAIYERVMGRNASASASFSGMTVKEFIHFSAIVSTLGSSRGIDTLMGDYDPSALKTIESVDMNVLKAALVVPRAKGVSVFTNGSLGGVIASLRGAKFVPEGDGGLYFVPGCPVSPSVGTTGFSRNRVVKGGHEFLSWHNSVHRTNYVFQEVSDHAIAYAFLLISRYAVEFKGDEVFFADRPPGSKSRILDVAGGRSDALSSLLAPAQTLVKNAYKRHDLRPSGIGHSKDTLSYLEVLLHKKFQLLNNKSYDNVVKGSELIVSEFEAKLKVMMSRIPQLFSKGLDHDPTVIGQIRSGVYEVGNLGLKLDRHDKLGTHVQEHRTQIRNRVDIPKKSSGGRTGVTGAASSVADKIGRAIEWLKAISPVVCESADAFGIGAKNHWERTLKASFPTVPICYYDHNPNYAKEVEGAQVKNINQLPPDYGKGKILFDDTLCIMENYKNQSDKTKIIEAAKGQAIVSAGYECGIIKAYLGTASDLNVGITRLPVLLETIKASYPRIALSQGGSVHTPEYYIVFSKGEGKWAAPGLSTRRTNAGDEFRSYVPGPEVPDGFAVDKLETRRENYLQTWIAIKIYEMLRANMISSMQVIHGCALRPTVPTWLGGLNGPDANVEWLFSGNVAPNAQVDEGEIVTVPRPTISVDDTSEL